MSTGIEQIRHSIGIRLAGERKRVGLSQAELGTVGGVKKLAQSNYELGKRAPNSDYLGAILVTGVDVQYVITGLRSTNVAEIAENYAGHHVAGGELDPLLGQKRVVKQSIDDTDDADLLADIQALVGALKKQRSGRG